MTYGKKHLYIILIIVTLITGLSYYLLDTKNEDIFYNWKWSTYFVVMLLGTIAGNIKYTQPGLYDKISPSKSIIVLIISIATYYYT